MKGFVDGKPVTKMLVDGGAAVNIMPYVMLRKLGKSQDDLSKTDMMLKDFEGDVSPALGALCVVLTIGSKTLPTTFFVINNIQFTFGSGLDSCQLLHSFYYASMSHTMD